MPETMPTIDIEREIRNLNAILEVSKAMSSEIQLDNLLQVIVQKTVEIMEADLASLFLYDEGRNELWSKIAHKLGQLQEIRFSVGVGIAGDVAKTRQTATLPMPIRTRDSIRTSTNRQGIRRALFFVCP